MDVYKNFSAHTIVVIGVVCMLCGVGWYVYTSIMQGGASQDAQKGVVSVDRMPDRATSSVQDTFRRAPSPVLPIEMPVEEKAHITQKSSKMILDENKIQTILVFDSQKSVADNMQVYKSFLTEGEWVIKNSYSTTTLASFYAEREGAIVNIAIIGGDAGNPVTRSQVSITQLVPNK